MRFNIILPKEASHTSAVTCIGWSGTEEVYSAGDDNKLLSWSVSNNESTKVAEFNSDLYPLSMHFLPRSGGALGKHGDLLLLTSSDGKFHIMNRTGRMERSVEAHKGAILVGQWSGDGAGLLTAGEDGYIKIWSKGGMLRSTVVQSDNSVYDACWAPDNQSIAYTLGKFIVVKQLAPNTKPQKWRAHEGLVMCLAWSAVCEFIISGGEDCRYRVWDSQGRPLYTSTLHDHPITSVAWSPNGDLFAIGSYDTLRLCDYLGWSRSLDKPTTGSIYKLGWSSDGTQVAGACANGYVLFAHVIERQISYLNYTAVVTERKTITVQDISNDVTEVLELPERVIQLALRYSHLVVTTPTQCYIYNTSHWNTPHIFDLKDGSVILLLLCEKHMLLVERSTISIYNYQGRLMASPRWPNMRLEQLRNFHISLSGDTLAVKDASDPKTVHAIDLSSNRNSEATTTIQHHLPIMQIALDQAGVPTQRNLAVLDRNRDLYIVQVRSPHKLLQKLGTQIQSLQWNTDENMLAAVQDVQVVVWYFPTSCFNPTLLKTSSLVYNSSELGRSPRIDSFVGNSVAVRRADGSLVNVPISPFPALLHRSVQENKWEEALKLCRTINETVLWAGLAVLSIQSNNTNLLDTAEEAFAAINHYDKVYYIQYIKGLTNKAQQLAGAAMLSGCPNTAESILLHNGLVYQAILNNIQLHNWNRALDLATKHKIHVDVVLYLRQQYLDALEKEENNAKFLSLKETVTYDKEKMREKLEIEGF